MKKQIHTAPTFVNTLYYGDNLAVLKRLSKDKDFFVKTNGGIDLVYIDPPFNSSRVYNMPYEDMLRSRANGEKYTAQKEAFNDTWSNVELSVELEEMKGYTDKPILYRFLQRNRDIFSPAQMSYLTMMAHRLYYIHKVLKETGSFYLHCDPYMSHYLKVLCDMVFGTKCFRNEIVWCYNTEGKPKKFFAKKHDVILLYSKSQYPENVTFNRISILPSDVKRYNKIDEKGEKYQIDGKGYKYFLKDGRYCPDYWNISALTNKSKERLGYPTQKPEALLERIIRASSNEGDIVADFFCGCGTAVTTAQKLGRRWIGADINHLAISLIESKRLIPLKAEYEVAGLPIDIAGAEKLANDDKFKFEEWVVEYKFGGHQTKKTGDDGIDGYIAYTFGGKKLMAVIEVKGGGVKIEQIRAFRDRIKTFDADFGIFVSFKKHITRGMQAEADTLGFIEAENLFARPKRMYIITIEDLVEDNLPAELKQMAKNVTY